MTDTTERELQDRLKAMGFPPDANEHTLLDHIQYQTVKLAEVIDVYDQLEQRKSWGKLYLQTTMMVAKLAIKVEKYKLLMPYLRHTDECSKHIVHHAFNPVCDCGLDDLPIPSEEVDDVLP